VKIAVGQINPTVGDMSGNAGRINKVVSRAVQEGADLVIFPELTATGYPPRDLLLRPDIINRVEKVLEVDISPASRQVGILIGAPVRSREGQLFNAALLYSGGRLLGRQDKTLLPNYDVFDENRYFLPAERRKLIAFGGLNLGVTICEDIWNDKDYWGEVRYDVDPVADLVSDGADLIINISASPYNAGKCLLRGRMLCSTAKKYHRSIIYVNQVGGNDELVFDGSSLQINAAGEVVWHAKSFQEDFAVLNAVSSGPGRAGFSGPAEEGIQDIFDALVLGVQDYMRKTGFSQAVVGLSGGIDSAVTAALACAAVGPENVLGVAMPSRYSSRESLEDARSLSDNLGMQLRTIPIDSVFSSYLDTFYPGNPVQVDTAEENLQARIRGNILMFISNREGHLVLSTGNKSELAVGYSTLYGDMSGGLAVLADVPKTMVYQLANYINRSRIIIPPRIISKPPSAELSPGQVDADSLPPYPVLDEILKAYIEDNLSEDEIVQLQGSRDLVRDVLRKVDRAEFKRRQAAPGLRVTTKAFGMGRRFPIAWRRG